MCIWFSCYNIRQNGTVEILRKLKNSWSAVMPWVLNVTKMNAYIYYVVVHGYKKEVVLALVESCISVIEIARHFDITAIFNLHGTK